MKSNQGLEPQRREAREENLVLYDSMQDFLFDVLRVLCAFAVNVFGNLT
jgi:hypothetical protein